MSSYLEKIPDLVVKSVVGLVTGGGVLSAAEWTWFGKIVFASFSATLGIAFQEQQADLIDYRVWSSGILFDSLPEDVGIGAIAALGLLLALLAHVLYKGTRQERMAAAAAAGEADAPRPPAPLLERLRDQYDRRYFLLTIVGFLVLVGLLWTSRGVLAMVALFVLLVVPIAVYAVFYSKDLLRGGFAERFVYTALVLCLLLGLIGLPRQYGRHAFDPLIWQVSSAEIDLDASQTAFVFEDIKGVMGIFTSLPEGKLTISLSALGEADEPERDIRPARLRAWKEKGLFEGAPVAPDSPPSVDEINDLIG